MKVKKLLVLLTVAACMAVAGQALAANPAYKVSEKVEFKD